MSRYPIRARDIDLEIVVHNNSRLHKYGMHFPTLRNAYLKVSF